MLLAAGGVWGQDSSGVVLIGGISNRGSVEDFVIDGGYMYVAAKAGGVRILDISNQANPVEISSCCIGGDVRDLTYYNGYVYASDFYSGIQVIDVNDPENPEVINLIELSSYTNCVTSAEGFIFTSDGLDVKSYNLANPDDPEFTGVISAGVTGVYDIYVNQGIAYVIVNYWEGHWLFRFDVSDPANMVSVGGLMDCGSVYDIVVEGDYAYITTWYSPFAWYTGLEIWDLSLGWPEYRGSNEDILEGWGVAVQGNYAYIADGTNGLKTANVSHPADPVMVSTTPIDGTANCVEIIGDNCFVGNQYKGIEVYDVSEVSSPAAIGHYYGVANYLDIGLAGDYGYVTFTGFGLVVIDISDPEEPVTAASFRGTNYSRILVDDSVAYVTCGDYGLTILNIADPLNVVEMGSVEAIEDAKYLDSENGYVYVSTGYGGMVIVDASDPANPFIAGSIDPGNYMHEIDVCGDYVYTTNGLSGLYIININDPANPYIAGNYDPQSQLKVVSVRGEYAYAATTSQFYVINVSDPENPFEAGNHDLPGSYVNGITIEGDFAYVALGTDGFRVFNISDPANPRLTGYHSGVNSCVSIAVKDQYAMVTEGSFFGIYDCSEALPVEKQSVVERPATFSLSSIYPNPFNNSMTVEYQVARAGDVRLAVYDVLGRTVGVIQDGYVVPGNYSYQWDAGNNASGVYYIQLEQGEQKQVSKAVLVK